MNNEEEAIRILNKYDQQEIIDYIQNRSSDTNKEKIIKQVLSFDFEQLKDLYKISTNKNEVSYMIEHVSFTDKYKMDEKLKKKCIEVAEEEIKSGHYAAVTMAGGQGTRLGHDGPKGTFLIDVNPKPKYLFEIIIDGLKKANEKYNVTIPWYIMTSSENNKKTVEFLEEHEYFGYPKDHVMIFKQGNMPILNEQGKLIIGPEGLIKEAADGNGCIYKSMAKEGVLDDMKKRGVKWIFIGAVDNVLLQMVDPVLLGLTICQNNKIASKSIVKRSPTEPVGVFCKKNAAPGVIEYTELPKQMAEETDEDGELLYGEAHIMCNLYTLDALEEISKKMLPYHSAHKKAPYISHTGELIKPTTPNAYKYEAFIFDGFQFFPDISILRGRREEDFAPVKNMEGEDSPETARILYNEYHK